MLVSATEFKTSDYRAMVAEVRDECPDLREVSVHRRPRVGAADGDRPRRRPRAAGRARDASCRPTTRSTSSTRRAPPASRRARRSPTTTSSTTGSSSARAAATPRPTASASRCPSTTASAWAWATSAATSHGATHGHPGARLRPRADAAGGAGRAVHLAVRRADDVHRRAGAARLRRLRPVVAAHRHHGRLAVPGRGDEAGGQRDGHDRGDDLLRHDRDVAGVDPDRRRRRPRPAHVHRRPGAPARRGQGRRPGDRADRAARGRRASSAPAATR